MDLFACRGRANVANLLGATSYGATDARANWMGGTFSTPDCGGVDNAQVVVTVADADLASAPSDSYTGVLTLLVAPQ